MDNEPQKFATRAERAAAEAADRAAQKGKKRERGPRGPKKSHLVRNIILAVIAVLAIAGGAYAAKVYNDTKQAVNDTYKSTGVKKLRNVSAVLSKGKAFSILLMGTDTGELGRDYKGRTDSIMLVTVNPDKKKTTIMSLPRDQVTAVAGYEDSFPQKLNAAYTFGSAGTTIKTVQKWLNVPIDYYALVNMGALESIVNQLGGVQVESPLTFSYDPDSAHETGHDYYTFTKGSKTFNHYVDYKEQGEKDTMDGAAALAFSRMRYTDPQGDYGRQQRQRLVLEAIIDKAKSKPTTLVNKKFLNTISDNTQTDLTFDDMLTIISKYTSAGGKLVSDHAQGTSIMLSGVSYEFVEHDEQQRVTNVLRKSLGLAEEETGNPFGSADISDATIARYGLTTLVNAGRSASSTTTDDTTSTYGTTTTR